MPPSGLLRPSPRRMGLGGFGGRCGGITSPSPLCLSQRKIFGELLATLFHTGLGPAGISINRAGTLAQRWYRLDLHHLRQDSAAAGKIDLGKSEIRPDQRCIFALAGALHRVPGNGFRTPETRNSQSNSFDHPRTRQVLRPVQHSMAVLVQVTLAGKSGLARCLETEHCSENDRKRNAAHEEQPIHIFEPPQ